MRSCSYFRSTLYPRWSWFKVTKYINTYVCMHITLLQSDWCYEYIQNTKKFIQRVESNESSKRFKFEILEFSRDSTRTTIPFSKESLSSWVVCCYLCLDWNVFDSDSPISSMQTFTGSKVLISHPSCFTESTKTLRKIRFLRASIVSRFYSETWN